LGRVWARGALAQGDSVAAAARSEALLDALGEEFGERVLPIHLDVSDREADFAAVARANEHFGRLDVIVNNAGYGVYGAVEELSEKEARDLMDTNLFGALWITQAAIPILRQQGGGHILQVSSVGGHISGPTLGIYHASKWALEGLSQSLAREVAEFGIKVTLLEPTGYRTEAEGAARHAAPMAAYEPTRQRQAKMRAMMASREGDPQATWQAIRRIVDAEKPPLRLLLGDGPLQTLTAEYESRLATWREWEAISRAAHGVSPEPG
jgi:NAD(P)-dependent dehydrogenase (short-subunit alcohol dehydrogenase family)